MTHGKLIHKDTITDKIQKSHNKILLNAENEDHNENATNANTSANASRLNNSNNTNSDNSNLHAIAAASVVITKTVGVGSLTGNLQTDVDNTIKALLVPTKQISTNTTDCFNQGQQGTCFANTLASVYLKSKNISMSQVNNTNSNLVPSRLFLQVGQSLLCSGLSPLYFMKNNMIYTTGNDAKLDLLADNGGQCTITPLQLMIGAINENIWNYVAPWVSQFDIFYAPIQDNPLITPNLTSQTLMTAATSNGNTLITIPGYKNIFASGYQNIMTGSITNGVLNITCVDSSLKNSSPITTTGTISSTNYVISSSVYDMINNMINAESPINTGFPETYVINMIQNMVTDLNNGKYLTIGFLVYSDFYNSIVVNNGIYAPTVNKPNNYTANNLAGGHAVTITGMWQQADLLTLYKGNTTALNAINAAKSNYWLQVQNSWGNSWGNNGRFFLPMTSFMSTLVDPVTLGLPYNVVINMFTLGYTTTN